MPNSDTATATLEERVRAIEDRLEIYNLIASHPPSADTGADYYTRAVYAEDGVFDRGEVAHAANLFDMDQKYANVMPSADVVAYLARCPARS